MCAQALDRWENRLEAIFEGRPYDALDAALTDTVARFPVHIQPFRCGCVLRVGRLAYRRRGASHSWVFVRLRRRAWLARADPADSLAALHTLCYYCAGT